jgi:GDP-D-mannose 3', 5'-epimerase
MECAPINLGTSELVPINQLVDDIEEIAGIKMERKYILDAPRGVAGRNSDNTMIKDILGWEPNLPLKEGLKPTYKWIQQQYADRKAGKRVVQD